MQLSPKISSPTVAEATVQAIFNSGYDEYEQSQRLSDHVRKAANKIRSCRTAALGGHKQSCPDGHFSRIWYNSCKHRLCPQCACLQIEKWLVKQKARLLKTDHFHVIFTIPANLRFLWHNHQNVPLMTGILFSCTRDTLMELLGDKKYLGGKPGIISSIHTWSKTLFLHPHVHSLVTGGGLSGSGAWKSVKKNYLLPFAVARDLFRGKVCDALREALKRGDIALPEDMRPQKFSNLLNKLGRKKWNVKIQDKYSHGNGVATYLARYLRGGPIKNSRIIRFEEGQVTLNYGREKVALMKLTTAEFIERYLQHVPLPNAILVRSYGLYHHTGADELEKCRELLGQEPFEEPDKINWQDLFKESEEHPGLCPVCGKCLVCTELIEPPGKYQSSHSPPPGSEWYLTEEEADLIAA
jgi:hypothetical protein